MRKFLLLFTLMYVFTQVFGQTYTPQQLGFEARKVESNDLGDVNYYITPSADDKSNPLLVYLDGSGAFPLFQKVSQGIGSTVVLNYNELAANYRVVLISKPGIPFMDEVGADENGFPVYEAPKEYHQRLSLDWRLNATLAVLNDLVSDSLANTNEVVLFGFSEGAQVAPFVAQNWSGVSHLLLFGGNGLNQFFDPLITARQKALKGWMSEQEAQAEIDSLYSVYEDIYKNPESTDKMWYGHTYLRWSSFTRVDPMEVLLQLDMPIYFANGSLDENSVLSADYMKLMFIKENKQNLTYKTYPGYDHQFNLMQIEEGVIVGAEPRLTSVLSEAFNWLKSQP